MVEKDVVRRGYDGVADEYADRRSFDESERAILEEFLDALSPDPLLLDAGCGQGTPVLRALAERHPDSPPVGVDISARQLERAADRVPGARLLQGDITRLPLGDSTVDGVAAFHSLIHVPADQHRRVLEEVARVLRPGGRILVSEGAGQWDGRNPDWLDTGVEMQWYIAGAPTTRRQLRSVGFTIGNEQSVSNEDESWVFFDAVLGE